MSERSVRLVLFIGLCCACAALVGFLQSQTSQNPITREIITAAEKLVGLQWTDAKTDSMLDGLKDQLENYQNIRKVSLANSVPPAILFNPIPVGMKFGKTRKPFKVSPVGKVSVPANIEEMAFYSVGQLGQLVRSKRVTSEELTRMYIARLKKYGRKLECVITLTEDRAIEQARRADQEIAEGKYRGPLHGIPYGAKDLLAVRGYKTTWGSAPFRDQVIDEDATVIKRLDEAGAVLVAKLTMGELAWGDVWYGGMTRNPWNYKEG